MTGTAENGAARKQARDKRLLIVGAGFGALLGLLSTYLYSRAADEHGDGDAGGGSLSTGQVLAVLVAIVGLLRQIAELGKPKKSDKGDKK